MSKPSSNFLRKFLLGAMGTILIYLPVQESLAQLEEIVVTSRRFEESITDAPIAVAVMGMDFLQDQQHSGHSRNNAWRYMGPVRRGAARTINARNFWRYFW